MRVLLTCLSLILLSAGSGEVFAQSAKGSAAARASSKPSKTKKARKTRRTRRSYSRRYIERTYADSTAGDSIVGEDLTVRRAAIEALGKFNGSVVVVDASNGRVLTIVNQKLALSSGYMPCSTIKLVVGLAALNEGIVEPAQKVWFQGTWFMTMVEGLAISNNVYFEYLGRKLGFERFHRYARMFGFGEKAGWRIPGEQLGKFPETEHRWGVARMSSFGQGISVTPLQLAAFASALANGGTLYYLQKPVTTQELDGFQGRVKRRLPIVRWLPEVRAGMEEAVKRGTGKKARTPGQVVYGKTGTCSQYHRPGRTRLGWFVSYNKGAGKELAVVVLLRGGPMMYGPRAAEIAGDIYGSLESRQYFTSHPGTREVVSLGINNCCAP